MPYKHHTSIFIFRQDLRLEDNKGLIKAINESKEILPIFIFDENILANFPPQSAVVWFIVDALQKLDSDLQKRWSYLSVYYWDTKKIIPTLIKKYNIDGVYRNESYWYGAIDRDVWVKDRCRKHAIACYDSHDFLIVPIDAIPARKVFTPFYKLRQKYIQEKPHILEIDIIPNKIQSPKIDISNLSQIEKKLDFIPNTQRPIWFWDKRKDNFSFSTYNETRNIPSIDGSSKLSPYIRFWLLSIRELYIKAKNDEAQVYISELAWREFRQHIFYNFPLSRTLEFQEKKRNIKRNNNKKHFEAWQNGMTWYPLVDAGMRQLKAENRIHNRVRMVVASFLTKDLLIDRRWWESHFAKFLIDYDTNVNIGNRQRSASVWADPKPLRIFSPMLQSKRFDPDCKYIKKWLPELEKHSPKEIHDPLNYDLWYSKPIVDHYEQSKKAKEVYKESWAHSFRLH